MTIAIGSISSGTLRTQDLLRSFSEAYKQYCTDEPIYSEELISRAKMFADHLDRHPDSHGKNGETAAEILSDLAFALDEVAVKYDCYFGTHEGDGSDFGFWPQPQCPEGWEYAETGTEDD